MKSYTLNHCSPIPAYTWNRLNLNEQCLTLPKTKLTKKTELNQQGLLHDSDVSFADALLHIDERVQQSRDISPTTQAAQSHLDASVLDTRALSAYQKRLEACEAQPCAATAFKSGVGPEVREYILHEPAHVQVLRVPAHTSAQLVIKLHAQDDTCICDAFDIIVEDHAQFSLSIIWTGQVSIQSILALSVRIACLDHAKLTIKELMCTTGPAIVIDDCGISLSHNAYASLEHQCLSQGQILIGHTYDMRGNNCSVNVDQRYLAHASTTTDMLYTLNQRGTNGECNLNARGVLLDHAVKSLRSTIDFIRGCAGSVGHELENTLIIGEDAQSKSLPSILCGEDDVEGDHGATIGHIDDEHFFYMSSRGLTRAAAEQLIVSAHLHYAFASTDDNDAHTSLKALAKKLNCEDCL